MTYGNLQCSSDDECPQTAVCGATNNCISPYDDSHSCGGSTGILCGLSAECVDGGCYPLYNYGKNCTYRNTCGKSNALTIEPKLS